MKKVLFTVFLLVGLLSMSDLVLAENDWQYWSQYEASIPIEDNLVLKIKPEFRYKDDFKDYYYSHMETGLDWEANERFVLGIYYRYINEEKEDDWQVENRPHLDATLKWKLSSLSFSDRNMVEYRIREDKEFFRYRNRLMVKFPKCTSFNIQPYIAEEPFYDFDAEQLNKNRLYAGIDFKIYENLAGGIYYALESNKKEGDWSEVNIFSTKLKYSF